MAVTEFPLLTSALSRLGGEGLSELLGADAVQLLGQLDLKNVGASSLAMLAVNLIGADEILRNSAHRRRLLEALRVDDASRLLTLLGGVTSDDPWAELYRLQFRFGTLEYNILQSFFGVTATLAVPPTSAEPEGIVRPRYPLFTHQIAAATKVTESLLRHDRPRVLLHMPTGSGKTRTAMNVVCEQLRQIKCNNCPILWLAHNEELCEQAVEEFTAAWSTLGNRNLPIHSFFGSRAQEGLLDSVVDGFVVGSLQLLFSRSKISQSEFLRFAQRVGLVVMDEAHMAMAPSYQHLLRMLTADPKTGVFGLSATPGRSTFDASQDVALANFFNRTKVTLTVPGYDNPVDFLQAEGYLAKIQFDRIPYAPSNELSLSAVEVAAIREGFDLPYEVIRRLGTDAQRNFLILNKIRKEAQTGAKMLVFGCSVDHAKLLANLLIALGLKAAVVTSETRHDRRRQIIREYRDTDEIQILTNYGVLTTGFDAPRTSVAVITRPTNSVVLYSQMVGRAARGVRAGGNSTCRVITVVDAIPGFRSMAEAFTYWDDIWE